ncbi:MAG: sulfite exporter TauE/SafE family protein [Planctomycetes bacterium]|nr:sulfite exporter TauE/SafE family protein [Planctomycetota bacterium]
MTTGTQGLVLFVAAVLAGAINAVAGGGTLVTFPALLWAIGDAKFANATSTLALWPGSLGGVWGYRRELRQCEQWMFFLLVPSVVGGVAGARLLLSTAPETFLAIVPYLILSATILFTLQGQLGRMLRDREAAVPPSGWLILGVASYQLMIASYGCYFGAGIGILMLSALSLLRMRDINQMNGLKSLCAACINGVAAGLFAYWQIVDWPKAAVMITGSILGGYGGASVARRLGQGTVRWTVVVIGLAITTIMLYKQVS